MLARILQLPKKGLADLRLSQLATMFVQMHVHNAMYSCRYV